MKSHMDFRISLIRWWRRWVSLWQRWSALVVRRLRLLLHPCVDGDGMTSPFPCSSLLHLRFVAVPSTVCCAGAGHPITVRAHLGHSGPDIYTARGEQPTRGRAACAAGCRGARGYPWRRLPVSTEQRTLGGSDYLTARMWIRNCKCVGDSLFLCLLSLLGMA